ncbi:replication initiation factor domain-containing protein [Enterococcus sp. BWB1-3]|uniref:replication initiation factor domain-containing protein n=1 Tax=Enterococcus sp. BWB1-3 TaxID=2787713 RepID=UPI0019214429|nr:replication initiation factor domain-containing protein [Enterococcus sp. BWB1-3]MBL1231021.1 replication initiation factor domain-containing protein [Enterococcus sp. BWB1-3]
MNEPTTDIQSNELRYITIDWLTLSFADETFDIMEVISEYLHLNPMDFEFKQLGLGASYHYGNTASFNDIQVFYSTNLDIQNGYNKGFTINISGQGCRQYESARWANNSNWTWYDTLRELEHLGGKCTHMDIAHDFVNSKYTWQFLLKKIYAKTLIYRGKVVRYNKINTRTGEDYHASIYIGGKPQQLNIYDKKGERFDKAGEEYDVESWTRWELRLGSDKAHMAFLELVEGRVLADLFAGILGAHYKFVTLTGDKNRSRRDIARWWSAFIGGAKLTKLYVTKDKPTLKKKENWLEKHGPDKAELMLYVRDLFVYGADNALNTLIKRLQVQSKNFTSADIQILLQGILEECFNAGVVMDQVKRNDIVNQVHKILEGSF